VIQLTNTIWNNTSEMCCVHTRNSVCKLKSEYCNCKCPSLTGSCCYHFLLFDASCVSFYSGKKWHCLKAGHNTNVTIVDGRAVDSCRLVTNTQTAAVQIKCNTLMCSCLSTSRSLALTASSSTVLDRSWCLTSVHINSSPYNQSRSSLCPVSSSPIAWPW